MLDKNRKAEPSRLIESLKQRVTELEKALREQEQHAAVHQRAVDAHAHRESEELRATLYGIGDAVISADTGGRVVRMNRTAEQLTGWTETEATGMPLEDVFHIINEATLHRVESPVTHVLREGTISGLANHTILISRDGRKIPIVDSGAPIFDTQKNITGVVLIFRDQSEERLNQRFIETRLSLIEFAACHTLDELLMRALDDVGDFVGSPIGFYHFVEADQKTLSLQAWSTRTLKEFCRAEGKGRHYCVDHAGVWVDCVKERRVVIHNDYATLPHKKGIPEGHARLIRELVVPVFRDDKVVAILGVGNKPVDYTRNDVKIVSFLADVTWEIVSRKRAEEELQRSNDMLRAIIDTAPVAIIGLDLGGNVHSVWNKTAEKMFGWSAPEVMGRSLPTVPAERREDFREFRERMRSGRTMDGVEVPAKRRDGSLVHCSTHATSLRGTDGNIIGSIAVLVDITERRRMDESVRKLSEAIAQSPVSIVITDASGAIEFVNRKFTEITGYSKAEALNQNPRILKSDETPPEEYERLWETISSGKVWKGRFHNRKKSGELFWEHATIAPIRDSDNTITHYVGIKEDITEHKALEEQFRQAQKMESVGRLAGGVAHDFNNLLWVIMGNTELAMSEANQAPQLISHLEGIQKAAERSADLTRQLLAFARKQTVSPRVLDLNKTVAEMLKIVRRLIGEDINLLWRPAEKVWSVKMDPSQIDQILANLCVNARDAIEGVGKLTIETDNITIDEAYCATHAGFIPGDFALLAVSDNGCGMDRETIDKIFDPFFTTKELGKGTGLGLATVYGIVKQNNGFINVYSELGQGTIFKIYLPKHEFEVDQVPKKHEPPLIVQGYETILVVEDEPVVLELACEMLRRLGYRVLSAISPEEAIRVTTEYDDPIHLLISDVIMPGMNGPDLANATRAMHPEIASLFMSGYSENVIVHHGVLDEGFNFIQKPFSAQILSEKIREVLEKG